MPYKDEIGFVFVILKDLSKKPEDQKMQPAEAEASPLKRKEPDNAQEDRNKQDEALK